MEDRLRTLRTLLAEREGIALAYLFGSQARGDAGPASDLDLAVLVDAPSAEFRYRLAYVVGEVLGEARVDVVLLNSAPVELIYAIISEGVLVYQRDLASRVEFEARALARYGDYLPVLRRQREDILGGRRYEAGVRRHREALGRTERALAAFGATESQGSG